MRHPFFFFNADTDCPNYLLGWVREPGMALEPSPERRINMYTQTHRTCIRMSTEEQYQRLCRYLAITRLPVTTYFRKLIKEATIHTRMPRQKIDPHPAVNHIYSNIRQIARCPKARALVPEQIAQREFLADKLCEECFFLSTQQ